MNTLDEGRLWLADVLGEGGMSTVHRAWDARSGEWRAVKLLAPAYLRSRSLRKRFRREALVMGRLDHSGIVRVHGLGEDRGQLYIEMELVRGRCLHTWTTLHGPMPAALALEAVIQVCRTVAIAHEVGVIHRDLKPQNIMVSPGGACRVLDFGIARVLGDVSSTRTGQTIGSFGFMAPEQKRDAKLVDQRADVYSLGATLLALVSGRPPLDMDRALEVASEHLDQAVMFALVRATASRRAFRTGSVQQLRLQLERARAALPPIPAGTHSLHIPIPEPSSLSLPSCRDQAV